jgi:hypothetical protein
MRVPLESEAFFYETRTRALVSRNERPPRRALALRAKLTHLDSTLPIFDVRTYDRVVKDDTEVRRFTASLLGVFAGVALFLATIGIYGVLSYTIEQRTHEIGVRMALGASGSVVVKMIVLQAMRTVGVGLAIGIAAALALTRYISSTALLLGMPPPRTYNQLSKRPQTVRRRGRSGQFKHGTSGAGGTPDCRSLCVLVCANVHVQCPLISQVPFDW